MQLDVRVVPVPEELWPGVEALMQDERAEMAAYVPLDRRADGLWVVPRLDLYRSGAEQHRAWGVTAGDDLVGYALVRPVEDRHFVDACYVRPASRRRGVGRAAALGVVDALPGPWTIAYLRTNEPAAAFWPGVVRVAAGVSTVRRSERVHGGHRFAWLEFDTTGRRDE